MIEKKTGTIKSFDDTPIYYEVRGRGKPVILAYGIVCTMNHWRHQIKYFSDHYQIITFDYRGHHNTPAPQNHDNLSIDGVAQDIAAICQHLQIPKASFWGHSFGTQILLRTYDMYPELFESLVFVNGFATNPLKGMFGVDAVGRAFRILKDSYEKMPETAAYLWKSSVNNPIAMHFSALAGGFNLSLTSFKDIEIYSRGVANVGIDVFIQMFDQMTTYDGRSVLDRITVPTLILGGTKDRVTPPEFQRVLHKRIRGSEYISVPYGTHCTQLDMPELVNLSIERFLKRIQSESQ